MRDLRTPCRSRFTGTSAVTSISEPFDVFFDLLRFGSVPSDPKICRKFAQPSVHDRDRMP